MPRHPALLWTSLVLLAAAVVFFLLAVTGAYFAKPTPATDLGLYSVTFVLVGFGAGGLLLRWTRLHPPSLE